jgi:SAM-dependent methyltransferase
MTATATTPTEPRCPICGGTVFGPGPKGRASPNGAMPRCAGCQSLERHRIFRIMFDRLGPKDFAGWSAIQFSPDPTADPAWFAAHELSVYGEPGGLDIQSIERPDAAYDIVICSHVLEHVGDDRAALHELLRIAKPDGLLYLAFPDPFREEVTRARSCCRARRSAIAGSSKSSAVRSAYFPDLRFSRLPRRPKSAARASA